MLKQKLIKFMALTLAFVTAVSPLSACQVYATEINDNPEDNGIVMLTDADIEVVADDDINASAECLAVLKKMEGFAKYPYYDYGQYSVGYGTFCPTGDLERYRKDGITEKEAEKLLKSYLINLEKVLDAFLDRNGLDIPQNQYDALVLFSYNCGTSWMVNSTGIRSAVLNRKMNYEVIYEFSRWCNAGGQMLTSLIKRRLAEANLYLNGEYNHVGPSDYHYVKFDANGGSCGVRIQGYDVDEVATIKPVASHSEYSFAGWSTSKTGNKLITKLDGSLANKTVLYARWKDGTKYENADAPEKPVVNKDALNAEIAAAKELKENEYTADTWGVLKDALAAAENTAKDSKSEQTTVDSALSTLKAAIDALVKAEVKEEEKPAESDKEEVPEEPEKEETKPEEEKKEEDKKEESSSTSASVTVKVTATSLNVRKGPGTSYDKVDYLKMGQEVVITETKDVDGTLWGKFTKGWISLEYTNYKITTEDKVEQNNSSKNDSSNVTTPVSLSGKIVDCTTLRIRSGAGKVFGTVGYYSVGTKVNISEQTTYEGDAWGKTDKGWISMKYVKLDKTSSSNANSGSNSSNSNADYVMGTIINCTTLNIRKAPGSHNPRANIIAVGSKVKIYETTLVNDVKWGSIDQGWISLSYVKLDGELQNTTSTNTSSNQTTNEETASAAQSTGVIVNCVSLSVRAGAGTEYDRVGYIKVGTKVTVYEQKYVNDKVWGRIDKGWVSLNYVKMDEVAFNGVITTNGLKIRKDAGLQKEIVGTYAKGANVKITETKYADGMNWGKTDKGWISLNYVEKK